MAKILNPDENAPLELANLVSRGYTVAEARKQLGYVLPDEVPAEEPAQVDETPAPAEEPKKVVTPVKKGTKKASPSDGL